MAAHFRGLCSGGERPRRSRYSIGQVGIQEEESQHPGGKRVSKEEEDAGASSGPDTMPAGKEEAGGARGGAGVR